MEALDVVWKPGKSPIREISSEGSNTVTLTPIDAVESPTPLPYPVLTSVVEVLLLLNE